MGLLDRTRLLEAIAVLLVTVPACSKQRVPTRPMETVAEAPWPAGGLPKTVWTEVPLIMGKANLFEIEAELDSQKVVMLLDCGAAWVVIDSKAAERLKLPLKPAEGNVGGLGTATMASHVTQIKSLNLGTYTSGPLSARVLDLSAVNQSRTFNGDRAIDGLIGAAYLIDHMGVISYPSKKLYLRRN